ncbi:alpha/beta fold hydrolase [Paraburkholderia unamae]|uniref:alpha/beta fold hydrolase n=1 Tax=Paraburkholderia unamae TaxID=219649 RepID=UPI001CC62476|nr:alpha/beta hydrolase [Paraburkholderia unamae]
MRYFDLHAATETFDPLLYIHGLGCASSSDYPPVIASAAYSKPRSLLVDLMGSGFSDKPEDGQYTSDAQADVLSGFVTGQGLAKVSLFGHSAGAFIALKLAQRLPAQVDTLILCQPGLTDYGVSMLSSFTAMSEDQFVDGGFSQLVAQLKAQGGNDAWLGPFSVASQYAVYHWARSALDDNASEWLNALANLSATKGVILSDTATSDEIAKFEQAGCTVELVANAEHMIAYDNPDGLAAAISRLLPLSA